MGWYGKTQDPRSLCQHLFLENHTRLPEIAVPRYKIKYFHETGRKKGEKRKKHNCSSKAGALEITK
jgi:hypothetical protein